MSCSSARQRSTARRGDGKPLDEQSELRPVSPYAASKVAAEFLGLQAFLGRGLRVVRARPFNHVGPGQADDFVVSALARRMVEAELGQDRHRTGRQPRRLAGLHRRARRRAGLPAPGDERVAGEAYNVCSGRAISIAALAAEMAGAALLRGRARRGPGPLPSGRGPGALGRRLQARAARPAGSPRFPSPRPRRCPRLLARPAGLTQQGGWPEHPFAEVVACLAGLLDDHLHGLGEPVDDGLDGGSTALITWATVASKSLARLAIWSRPADGEPWRARPVAPSRGVAMSSRRRTCAFWKARTPKPIAT